LSSVQGGGGEAVDGKKRKRFCWAGRKPLSRMGETDRKKKEKTITKRVQPRTPFVRVSAPHHPRLKTERSHEKGGKRVLGGVRKTRAGGGGRFPDLTVNEKKVTQRTCWARHLGGRAPKGTGTEGETFLGGRGGKKRKNACLTGRKIKNKSVWQVQLIRKGGKKSDEQGTDCSIPAGRKGKKTKTREKKHRGCHRSRMIFWTKGRLGRNFCSPG